MLKCTSYVLDDFLVIYTNPISCYTNGQEYLNCGDAVVAKLSQMKNVSVYGKTTEFTAESVESAIEKHEELVDALSLKGCIDMMYGDYSDDVKKAAIEELQEFIDFWKEHIK